MDIVAALEMAHKILIAVNEDSSAPWMNEADELIITNAIKKASCEQENRDWDAGYQAAMRRILAEAMREIPWNEKQKAILLKERGEAIRALREICEIHGDNDWDDNLHLSDVIEKHLGRHLGT